MPDSYLLSWMNVKLNLRCCHIAFPWDSVDNSAEAEGIVSGYFTLSSEEAAIAMPKHLKLGVIIYIEQVK